MFGEAIRGGWAVPVEVAFDGLALFGVVTLTTRPLIEGAKPGAADAGELNHV